MIELPFDLPNADKILKDNFDAYLDSDDFKELIGVKKVGQGLIQKLETINQKLTDVVNEGDIQGKEYDEYYVIASKLSTQVIDIILIAKGQKQMLIDEIKKEIDNCMRAKARAKYVDTRDGFKQRIFAYNKCLELIEGIL